MRKTLPVLIYAIILFFCLELKAYASIAPLAIKEDGVEPIENPGVRIESADITATPDNDGFRFNCNYVFIGLVDGEDLTVGIPGDLGYTLEAGYIGNIKIALNGRPVKYKIFNTTPHLSENMKSYNSPINFKWHTFSIPVKKDVSVNVSISYDITWRMLEQSKSSPYNIVPFIMSTDKLFEGASGGYRIKYVSDDHISLPDVKVMINSMLEPNIISAEVLSPKWSDSEIVWEFKDHKDFQDFRLVSMSFSKLSMDFSERIKADNTIKWDILNENYEKLAVVFEDIARGRMNTGSELDSSELGTAAYLSSEFYMRQKNYGKALEMLSLPDKTNLWPLDIKYQYINSLKLKESNNHRQLLDELNKLQHQKDYILVSNYALSQIGPVNEILAREEAERKEAEEKDAEDKKKQEEKQAQEPVKTEENGLNTILFLTFIPVAGIAAFGIYRIKRYKK